MRTTEQEMNQPEVKIVSDGKDIFVVANGVKIAKRGRPGTAQAKTWVSLEPGWTVLDGSNQQIVVEYAQPEQPH
jgi:hypothetical protein